MSEPGAEWTRDDSQRWTRGSVWALAAICAVAAALRLAHLQQIAAHDPFFTLPEVDGAHYHAWAQRIAEGQVRPDGVLYLGPLYPYLMAAVYALFGPSLLVWKSIQCALGVVSCALVAQLALELFDRRVALLAAAFAALYRMLVFYGGNVMLVNVQVPLVLGVLILVVRALREPRPRRWAAAGLLLGVAALGRQTVLAFAPLAAAGFWWMQRKRLPARRRAALLAVFALAAALPIAPFTLHNVAASGEWVLLNATGGANLYMGNNPYTDGTWTRPRIAQLRIDNPVAMRDAFEAVAEQRSGRELGPAGVSRYWTGEAMAFVREHPLHWLALELNKLLLFLNAAEIWNIQSIEITREFSWVLRLPLLELGLLAPFGWLGLGLAAPRWRTLWPLYAMVGAELVSALAFFVLARYRMPAVPLLMIGAGFALVRGVEWARARRFGALAAAALAALALTAVVHRPVREPSLAMAYFNLGNKYRELARPVDAIGSYERALRIRPGFLSAVNNLALAYEEAGRRDAAIAAWRAVWNASVARGDARHRERAERHLEALGAPVNGAER